MPEYLAPGVYVEETSFRPKTIEGVSTSTAGFVGPARYGPTDGPPVFVSSFADFERVFGGLEPLSFGPNYLAHGVRAFFEEGGRRGYVARIIGAGAAKASYTPSSPPSSVTLQARFPGAAGTLRITFVPRLSDNLLIKDPISGANQIRRIQEHDTVVHTSDASPPVFALYDVVRTGDALKLHNAGGDQTVASLNPTTDVIRLLTLDVIIEHPIIRANRPSERFSTGEVLEGFSFHPLSANALTQYFQQTHTSGRLHRTVPFALLPDSSITSGYALAEVLLTNYTANSPSFTRDQVEDAQVFTLKGGTDGNTPTADAYRGNATARNKSGLAALEDVEDISIVAAPGYSAGYVGGSSTDKTNTEAIQAHLINHCTKMRYRIAVLDAADNMALDEVRAYRGKIDSKYAALYYPWVRVFNPITAREISLPPSGFVAGIYARNDVDHGVHKAPANEVVRLSVGFEFPINKAQQDVLNPEGVNCFRFFEGRGNRLWGARTATSDGEWKYVNLRRYFAYLERSIDKGTQVFVFENNGERLWANVRRTVEDFLFNEWKSGRLMGLTPEEAFFVRCDRSTMTQNDFDNGRLICLIGVAPLRPAEFVIFRIGQKLLETTPA